MSVLGAALIGGASLLGSSLLNKGAADETNALAKEQFERNMAFQQYQFNEQKKWSNYANQVKQMRKAGLNPAMMFGAGASPTSIGSVGGVSPTSAATTPDFSFLPSAAANLVTGFSQASLNKSVEDVNQTQSEKNQAEAQGYRIDNLFKNDFWKSSNYLRFMQGDLAKENAGIAKLQAQFDKESLGDRLLQQRWAAEETRARTEALLISNSYLPQRCQQEIANLIQSKKLMIQQGYATVKQAMAAIMQATSQAKAFSAQFGGDESQRGAFFNATLKSLEQSNRTKASEEYRNWLSPAYAGQFPHAVGSYNAGVSARRAYPQHWSR